jgi:mRNA interferase RelE/StbE
MKVIFKKSFLKAISKLPDHRLKLKISGIIENTEEASTLLEIKNVSKMKGFDDFYRIRLGQYRIGIKLEDDILFFVAFAHRKDIYKLFP